MDIQGNKQGTTHTQKRTHSVLAKNERVSNANKLSMANRAAYDNKDPLLVPSNRSTGTLRYMSRPAAHRLITAMVQFFLQMTREWRDVVLVCIFAFCVVIVLIG